MTIVLIAILCVGCFELGRIVQEVKNIENQIKILERK